MTLNKLASLISKKEGKKHQASIGDIREILAVLSDLLWIEMNGAGKNAFQIFNALEKSADARNNPKRPKRKSKRTAAPKALTKRRAPVSGKAGRK